MKIFIVTSSDCAQEGSFNGHAGFDEEKAMTHVHRLLGEWSLHVFMEVWENEERTEYWEYSMDDNTGLVTREKYT